MPKARIHKNVWDNWYGYIGKRKVIAFGNSRTETAEQAAHKWYADQCIRKCVHCGEPEDGGDFGWFDTEGEDTHCNKCGGNPLRKKR